MDGQKPEDMQQDQPVSLQPGTTVSPQNSPVLPKPVEAPMPQEPSPSLPAPAVPQTGNFTEPPVTTSSQDATDAPRQYPQPAEYEATDLQQPEVYGTSEFEEQQYDQGGSISWTASEFVGHHKSINWYMLLLFATSVVAMLVWLMTRDVISTFVVIFAGAIFATYAGRQPRELQYQIDPSGLTIGNKHFPYSDYRSFSVVPEGAFASIVLMPLKRFGTATTIYFGPDEGDEILRLLSSRLPHEQHKPDLLDSLLRRIRF